MAMLNAQPTPPPQATLNLPSQATLCCGSNPKPRSVSISLLVTPCCRSPFPFPTPQNSTPVLLPSHAALPISPVITNQALPRTSAGIPFLTRLLNLTGNLAPQSSNFLPSFPNMCAHLAVLRASISSGGTCGSAPPCFPGKMKPKRSTCCWGAGGGKARRLGAGKGPDQAVVGTIAPVA